MSLERIDAGVARPAPIIGEREWAAVERQANALASSNLVPPELRGKPADVLLVGIRGLELGLPLTQALAFLYPVKGRILTAAMLQIGLLHRAGHEVWFEESTATSCTIVGIRRGSTREHRATFTIEQAKAARLTEKDVWKSYPAAMLRARAATALVTMAFSDVLMGLDPMTPEQYGLDHYGDADIVSDKDALIDAPAIARAPDPGKESAAHPPPAAASEPDLAGLARNERTAIAGAMARIPEGTWRQAWAKAWRAADLPSSAHDLTDDQLEPARGLIRQYLVLAGLDTVGIRGDDERHRFIGAATAGATESCRALTSEQFGAVSEALRAELIALHEAEAQQGGDGQ